MARLSLFAAALSCLPLGGCVAGLVYTHTTQPLDLNLRETPLGTLAGAQDSKDLDLRYIRIVWDGNDIASAAEAAGMNEVHFADLETLSILGVWRQDWVHVYGR